MDHFGAPAEAENRRDIRRCPASDLLRVFHVVSAQAAADLRAVGTANDHRVAAGEAAFNLHDADRQQTIAPPQRRDRWSACPWVRACPRSIFFVPSPGCPWR